MKGLKNLGNTCYMNSALQMILRIDQINNIFETFLNNFDNPFDEELRLLSKFFFEYRRKDNVEVLNPKIIKQIMNKKYKSFQNYNQEDSHEFMIMFIDLLENKINDILKKYNLTNKINNPINDLLSCEITRTIKCKVVNCLYTSVNKEISSILFLEISDTCIDLDDCLNESYKKIKLEGDNLYFCEKCNKKRIASKKTDISKTSNNLIINLKRFIETRSGRLQKNDKEIDVPLIWQKRFKLKGIVYHSGSCFGGHYVYVGREGDDWFLFNDSYVSHISSLNALNKFKNYGYIYHFEKI